MAGNVYTYTADQLVAFVAESNNKEEFTNGIKVSSTDNPMYFPASTTYQVGSAEIVALASNAIAVGTGQTGAAPLYVFCKDGIYALMVDQSGEMAYTNARVIARDVCNNAKSVTPIDAGVVFTTDRGLMCIAGEEVQEIGQSLEGDLVPFYDSSDSVNYSKIVCNAYTMSKLGRLPEDTETKELFLDYLKDSIVNYNHNERELMVSNPNYSYSYVMDREVQWSRRDYSADEYVNNYPTSYRVVDGEFYQVDKESDSANGVFAMSNVIKLDSIGFKEINRLVARGYFETSDYIIGDVKVSGTKDIQLDISNGEYTMSVDSVNGSDVPVVLNGSTIGTFTANVKELTINITASSNTLSLSGTCTLKNLRIACDNYLGLYVFGSYDGRKWACLGHREKTGKFTDIGALVERTDCKFFRFVLAGQLTADSRLDYFEISSKGSKLSKKIR